ncbi:MAG TPA: hypothetical protein VGM84_22035 [Steroidobacteraceae bacterium]|jgi:hypothetical protein
MAAPTWEKLFKDYDKDLDKIEQDRKDEQAALKTQLAVEKKELENDLTRPNEDPKRMEAVGRLTDFEGYEKMEVGKVDAKADAWKKTVEAERDANKPETYPEAPKEAPKEEPQEEVKSGRFMQNIVDSTAGKFVQAGTELTAAAFAMTMQVKSIIAEYDVHHQAQNKEVHQIEQQQQHQEPGQQQSQHHPLQDQHKAQQQTQTQQSGGEKKDGPEPDLPHETAGEKKDEHMKKDIEEKAKEAEKPDSLKSVFNVKAPPPPPPPKPVEEQSVSKQH